VPCYQSGSNVCDKERHHRSHTMLNRPPVYTLFSTTFGCHPIVLHNNSHDSYAYCKQY